MPEEKKKNITILLPAGQVPLEIMKCVSELAEKYALGVYLSTLQNLKIINIPEPVVDEVKASLGALGADFKAPGKFPIPRTCLGKPHCDLAVIDTLEVSNAVLGHFASRKETKGKLKIAIAGCTVCCSAPKTSDIGLIATRNGYEVYAGGKGGAFPKIGRRIAKKMSEEKVMDVIEVLIDFHDRKTEKKQRMAKLLCEVDFPF